LQSVYLETTIPSYLAARDSSDVRMLAKQQITREWWDLRRSEFELFVSEFVVAESQAGDVEAAARRLALLAKIPLLEVTLEADQIAGILANELSLPKKATADAAHIAVCVVNGIDFLLTWNFTHIANAAFRPKIEQVCDSFGYDCPIICSPEELMWS
jgi:predicted nucleic acid-binding protein